MNLSNNIVGNLVVIDKLNKWIICIIKIYFGICSYLTVAGSDTDCTECRDLDNRYNNWGIGLILNK